MFREIILSLVFCRAADWQWCVDRGERPKRDEPGPAL